MRDVRDFLFGLKVLSVGGKLNSAAHERKCDPQRFASSYGGSGCSALACAARIAKPVSSSRYTRSVSPQTSRVKRNAGG